MTKAIKLLMVAAGAVLLMGSTAAQDYSNSALRNCVVMSFQDSTSGETIQDGDDLSFQVLYDMRETQPGINLQDCPDSIDLPKKSSNGYEAFLVPVSNSGEGFTGEVLETPGTESPRERFVDVVNEGEIKKPDSGTGKEGQVWSIQSNSRTNVRYNFPADLRDRSLSEIAGENGEVAFVIASGDGGRFEGVYLSKTYTVEGASQDSNTGTSDDSGNSDGSETSGSSSGDLSLESFSLTLQIDCQKSGGWNCDVQVSDVEASGSESSQSSESGSSSSSQDSSEDGSGGWFQFG